MSARDIIEVASALRKAVNRDNDDTESDSDYDEMVTNRGNKMRKRAKYVHEGQLAPNRKALLYKQTIAYGEPQHSRDIISRVPHLYDQDGYRLDSEEDDEEKIDIARNEAAEPYPYAQVHIDNLLAPLTAAGDLAQHPTLSKPFTSPILSQLTSNACAMLHKERASLWSLKHLLTKMGGDHIWCPTDMMEDDGDLALFPDDREAIRDKLYSKKPIIRQEEVQETEIVPESLGTENTEAVDIPEENKMSDPETTEPQTMAVDEPETTATVEATDPVEADTVMVNTAIHTPVIPRMSSPVAPVFSPISPVQVLGPTTDVTKETDEAAAMKKTEPEHDPDETLVDDSTIFEEDQDPSAAANGHDASLPQDVEADESDDNAPSPRRMRTRAQNVVTESIRSPTPESDTEQIDPYFLPPTNSIPSQYLGLPREESVEVKRILQLYIQKQEEVVRGSERIYNNLLRADRLRKEVFAWAKAEAHVGEMSDGEDWYDPDEWGLNGTELRKGQDEEEEQEVGDGKGAKKTRARRQ